MLSMENLKTFHFTRTSTIIVIDTRRVWYKWKCLGKNIHDNNSDCIYAIWKQANFDMKTCYFRDTKMSISIYKDKQNNSDHLTNFTSELLRNFKL